MEDSNENKDIKKVNPSNMMMFGKELENRLKEWHSKLFFEEMKELLPKLVRYSPELCTVVVEQPVTPLEPIVGLYPKIG